ncbi:hypothetical protein HY440_02750 [Candidatus Microgenomates bacterium]|nr:hypothetical protein [Candidatus Microgenomates bacterium]
MIFDFSCDIGHIRNDIPHQLWEATTADGNANTLVTRFFHNTPSFYANNFLKCYLSYLSPDFLSQTFTIFGLVLFGLGLWYLLIRRKWFILALLFLAPIFPLFDFPSNGLAQTIILYGTEGLVMLYGVKNLWKFFFS